MTQATQTTGRDLDDYALMDRYTRQTGRVFMTGTQALVRIALDQAKRDKAAGLNTAGFISGYRGSPLGGVDLELWRAKNLVEQHGIKFLPAVNEDLAATAVLGSQQVETNPAGEVQGVFGHLVRQGPRRRPRRRRAEARQRLWLVAAWRRAGRCRRRPWLRVLIDAAPVRCRLHGLVHADAEPVERRRISGLRRIRLCAVALFRHVGRLQGDLGNGRVRRTRSKLPPRRIFNDAGLHAARRPACTIAGRTCPARRSRSGWRRRRWRSSPSPKPTRSTAASTTFPTPPSASSPPARAIST